jgi:hypothetical protein
LPGHSREDEGFEPRSCRAGLKLKIRERAKLSNRSINVARESIPICGRGNTYPVSTPHWESLKSGVGAARGVISTHMPFLCLSFVSLLRRQTSDYFLLPTLKMLLQKPVLTRRPSGPTIVAVTGSLLFVLFLLTASRSGVRAKASAYFPGSDSSGISKDVLNRTLGVSFLANTAIWGAQL